jgi:sugar phosphate isomerase/epimerase
MSISYGFSVQDRDIEKLRKIIPCGFNWIEIPGEFSDPEFEEDLIKIGDEFGVNFSVHGRFVGGINPSAMYDSIRSASIQILKKDLEFARRIKAKKFVMHGGNIGWFDFLPQNYPSYAGYEKVSTYLREKHLQSLSVSVKELLEFVQNDIKLTVENMYFPWELLIDPQEIKEFANNFTGNISFGITLDFGHAKVRGHTPKEFIELLGDKIYHIHLHDNGGIYDEHMPLNNLSKDYTEGLRLLNSFSREVSAVLEFSPDCNKEINLIKKVLT